MNDALKKYFALLMKWNQKINLTAVKDEETFIQKHVKDVDELFPVIKNANSIVDLGSGAGIPGLMIKMQMPKAYVVMIESTRKKVSFIEEAIRALELGEDVLAVWGRAEDEGLMRGLGAFDICVSRATWKLKEFIYLASKYVNPKGLCVAMKGADWKAELSAATDILQAEHLVLKKTHEYSLSGGEKRCILVFQKISNPS
jgi:16S rRNA (guanine527-N7)-methyltransferase